MMDNTLFDCREEIKRLEAGAAAMREALEAADLILQQVLDMYPDVVIGGTRAIHEKAFAALNTDAGRLMLERLRLAEAERDDLQARLLALAEMRVVG